MFERQFDSIFLARYIPRPGTVSLQKLHDSGFIDLDDTTVPVTQRKKEFTQEDLTRTVDDVRNVVTEELRHCPRDILIAIESILKLTGKSPESKLFQLKHVHQICLHESRL